MAFTSFRKGNADIFVKNANGVGLETPIIESTFDEYVEDWSKDGQYLAYKQVQGEFEDLYVVALGADGKPGKPFPVVQGPFHKDEPQFSYDGKWLAYGSDESGRFEVYVTSFPELDQKIKVSNEGGGRPRWRKDSKEIYYMRISSGVMAVDFTPGPKIEAGIPHLLVHQQCAAGRGSQAASLRRIRRRAANPAANGIEHCRRPAGVGAHRTAELRGSSDAGNCR